MSVLNLCITPGRVAFLTDTLAYAGGKPVELTDRKAHVSANGRWAVAFRGLAVGADRFTGGPHYAAQVPILELPAAADALAAFLAVLPTLPGRWWEKTEGSIDVAMEATFAGPDATGTAVEVTRVRVPCGAGPEGATVESIGPGVHLRPSLGNHPLPAVVTDAQLMRLAMVQHKIQGTFGLPLSIGGIAHATVITPAGAVQRIEALFPDYHDLAARFGDPNADDVAAWLQQGAAA